MHEMERVDESEVNVFEPFGPFCRHTWQQKVE